MLVEHSLAIYGLLFLMHIQTENDVMIRDKVNVNSKLHFKINQRFISCKKASQKALFHSPIFLDLQLFSFFCYYAFCHVFSYVCMYVQIRNNIKEKGEEEITACDLDVKLRDDIAGNMIEYLEKW
ncbi:hypothetical protein E1A91_D13G158500v1 [Gossypium mustelinum]|uniref:Uncharacterized protein n=1 Tax=Gossypium mustelinum TaxID=34275 RepID=A0A5D2S698_GOSMU|nr:hypothetical protein E1A91_D13G158500v1 [Gossypium mustelinum]